MQNPKAGTFSSVCICILGKHPVNITDLQLTFSQGAISLGGGVNKKSLTQAMFLEIFEHDPYIHVNVTKTKVLQSTIYPYFCN